MTPKIKKIIAREGLFIFILVIISLALDLIVVQIFNFIDKSGWTWYITVDSALRSAVIFVVVGYAIRFSFHSIVWVVKTLKKK